MSQSDSGKKPGATGASCENYIGSTVGSFASRISQKLKIQEEQEGKDKEAQTVRHALMMQAMTTIRKTLQKTARLRLSDRFQFDLEISDHDGWPQMALLLIDASAPDRCDFGLIIGANDLKKQGMIQLSMRSGEILGALHLCNPEDTGRLPLLLKRSLRDFLDRAAEYILNPAKPSDSLEHETKSITDEELDHIQAALSKEELFNEDEYAAAQNLVEDSAGADDHAPIDIGGK